MTSTTSPREGMDELREIAREALRRGAPKGCAIPQCACFANGGRKARDCEGVCEDAVDHVVAAISRASTPTENEAGDLLAEIEAAGLDLTDPLINAERQRQESVEGWTLDHDCEHRDGELLHAAVIYLWWGTDKAAPLTSEGVPLSWPWDKKWWKPRSRVRNLVRAGALCLAEKRRIACKNFGRIQKVSDEHISQKLGIIRDELRKEITAISRARSASVTAELLENIRARWKHYRDASVTSEGYSNMERMAFGGRAGGLLEAIHMLEANRAPTPTAHGEGELREVREYDCRYGPDKGFLDTGAKHRRALLEAYDALLAKYRALSHAPASSVAQPAGEACTLWHDIVHCPTDGSEWEMKLSHGLTYHGRWSVSQQRWQKRSDKPYEPPCEDKWTTGVGWIWSNLPEGEYPVSYRALTSSTPTTEEEA